MMTDIVVSEYGNHASGTAMRASGWVRLARRGGFG
jgi:hypothetical protein